MVVGSDILAELPLERNISINDSRIVFTIKEVIDMGAPKMYSRQRLRLDDENANPQGGIAASSGKLRGRPSNISSKQRAGRRVSLNSGLSPKKLPGNRNLREQPPKKKSEVKKVTKLQSGGVEIQKRVKQRKHWRHLVPNPRLYQAPPNRPRAVPIPQCPLHAWSPPPKLAPQQTASQLALHLSTRTVIPFDQFLHQRKEILFKSTLRGSEDSYREKTRPEKLRSKSPSGTYPPLRKQENLQWSPKDFSVYTKRRTKRPLLPPERNGARKNKAVIKNPPIDLFSLTQNIGPTPFQDYAVSPKPQRYTPRSQHLRLATLNSDSTLPPAARLHKTPSLAIDPSMASTPQSSFAPEDGSDGNESLSAPSEYLAEFLSAIMSRKYADALKYCRLILYYEPDNATARSFYPLLRDKVADLTGKIIPTLEGKVHGSSTSEESGSSGADIPNVTPDEVEDGDEGSDSESDESVASLSLDSSGKSSRSVSPAVRGGTDSTSEGSAEPLGVTGAEVTATPACWLTDDNGNPSSYTHKPKDNEDEENDNAAGDHKLLLKDPTLQQLRAQFACSIK